MCSSHDDADAFLCFGVDILVIRQNRDQLNNGDYKQYRWWTHLRDVGHRAEPQGRRCDPIEQMSWA